MSKVSNITYSWFTGFLKGYYDVEGEDYDHEVTKSKSFKAPSIEEAENKWMLLNKKTLKAVHSYSISVIPGIVYIEHSLNQLIGNTRITVK